MKSIEENVNAIHNNLDQKLKLQKIIDYDSINKKYQGEELKEELGYLKEDYELYNTKLAEINNIKPERKAQYIKTIDQINGLTDIGDKRKLQMMLSYGVLLNYFGRLHERNFKEICVLADCTYDMDLEDYTYYIGILSNDEVSPAIVDKTPNFNDQVKIARAVMDSQDQFDYDFITRENYDILVNNALQEIKKYQLPAKKETKSL
jgi:hypothetical protein